MPEEIWKLELGEPQSEDWPTSSRGGIEQSFHGRSSCFPHTKVGKGAVTVVLNTEDDFSKVFEIFSQFGSQVVARASYEFRISLLERLMAEARSRLTQVEERHSVIVPIESFDPEPFLVVRPFHVVVEPSAGEFIATYYDANINATGDTTVEAVVNLKDIMLLTFETFEGQQNLGAALARQIAALDSIIRRK